MGEGVGVLTDCLLCGCNHYVVGGGVGVLTDCLVVRVYSLIVW